MSVGNVRKGVTQATFNQDAIRVVSVEIFLVAVIVGLIYQSWYVGGGLFLGLILGLLIPTLNLMLAIGFSIAWSVIAASVAYTFFGDGFQLVDLNFWEALLAMYSIPSSQVLGGIFFLSALGYHLAAIEWQRDVSDAADRNF